MRSVQGSRRAPIVDLAAVHADGSSMAQPDQEPGDRQERRPCPPIAPAHRPATPGSAQASPLLAAGPIFQHATAPSSGDTPGRRCGLMRYAVTRERLSTPRARSDAPLPASCSPEPAAARSPRARQMTDIDRTRALPMARTSLVACRPPSGTIARQPPAVCRRRPQHPRSIPPSQSLPRTVPVRPALPLAAALARVMALVQHDLIAAFASSSQTPPSRCCDDRLNPPSTPASRSSA